MQSIITKSEVDRTYLQIKAAVTMNLEQRIYFFPPFQLCEVICGRGV